MVEVIKRNGVREPFNPEKLTNAITKAAVDAGIQVERKKQLLTIVALRAIEMAAHKKQIESSVLRDNILDELEQTESKVAVAWEDYDQKHKSRQM
jgi:transcriptional regulator NrdR family protein